MKYFCDDMRHLVCVPFSIENLHVMAVELGIKRCWYHGRARGSHGRFYPHYDIPVRRIAEISSKCTVVSPREILSIIQEERQ